MDQKLKEASNLMLKILRNRSESDPLSRKEIEKLLTLYREISAGGEVYLELWWNKLKEKFPDEDLELLRILHQALLYRINDEKKSLEDQAKQREAKVQELLNNLEKEIKEKKIARGDLGEI